MAARSASGRPEPRPSALRISCCSGALAGHDNNAEIQSFGDQADHALWRHPASYRRRWRGWLQQSGAIQHGQWNAGVGSGTGNQNVLVYGGGTIDLDGGSGTGTQGYYGSDCYAVLGDACRGGSNDARIENVFAAQTINFSSGGQLNITGGSAGTKNSASIEGPDLGGDHAADPGQCQHHADRRQRRWQRAVLRRRKPRSVK
jgi:hypothetical protein